MFHCSCYYNYISICILVVVMLLVIILSIFLVPNLLQKNTLTALNSEVQTSTGGSATLLFNTNRIQNGNAITHTDASTEVILNESGTYLVSFNVTGSLDTGGFPSTSFSVELLQDSQAVSNTFVTSMVIPTGQSQSLSNTTLVDVTSLPSILQLSAFSTSSIFYQDTSISVVKID